MNNWQKVALRNVAKAGKLEECAQEMINELAQIIIKMDPEMAQNNPKEVGRLAKEAVKAWMTQVANS